MRVLFVTDFYHPYSGGVELHVRTVAAALAARDHRVAVATLPPPPDLRAEYPDRRVDGQDAQAVEVYTVHHSAERIGARFAHQDRPWAPPFPDPVTVRELRAVVREFQPNVIHGHDWLARSVLPRAVSGDIPIVTSLHYYTRTCAKKTLWRTDGICSGPELRTCLRCAADHYGTARGAVVTLGLRAGAKLEDRRTSRWISVSEATEAGNGLSTRRSSAVVANPVPGLGEKRSIELAPSDTNGVEIPTGPFMLFVGDIRPEKGVAVLAAAVELLRSEHGDDTPFVVVGERMSNAISLPTNTVEVGPVTNPVVQELWSRAEVGVVPSLWPEPFGLVAIEAMAGGCPLVASDVGGLSEILADGRGTLVPPGDPVALAKALSELLADPARRAEQAARASADVGRYDTDRIVDEIEAQYRLALGRS